MYRLVFFQLFVAVKAAPFIDVPVANPIKAVEEALVDTIGNVAAGAACNDGFKPGNVIVAQVPKLEPVALPIPLPEPCPPEDAPAIPNVPVLPASYNNYPYTYLSSSTSAARSANHQQTQTVLLQKLSCNNNN